MYAPSLKTRVRKSVLTKGNPNHDRLGRFTSASDVASAVVRRYADAMAGYRRMFPNHDRTKALKVAGRIAASAADMDTPEAKEFYKKNPDAARDEISSLKRETMRAGVPLYLLDAAGTELTPEERKRIVNDSFRSYQMTDDYGAHIKIAARSLYATGSVTRKPQSESFIGDESVRQIRELDAANLLYGIEHAPARTIPAWRGEKRETSPKVGDEINDGLLSFSTDPGVAESFGVSQVGGKAATIYKLEGPSQGLFEKDDFFRNGDWSPLDYEREYLTGGKFVVTSVGKTDAGVTLVTVQQVAPSRLGQPLAKFNPNHDERGRFATTNQRNTPLGKNVIEGVFHGGEKNLLSPLTGNPYGTRRVSSADIGYSEELPRSDADRLASDVYLPAIKLAGSVIGLDDLETHWRGADFYVSSAIGEGTHGAVIYKAYYDSKAGMTVDWPESLTINPSTSPERARLTISHEMGHMIDALLSSHRIGASKISEMASPDFVAKPPIPPDYKKPDAPPPEAVALMSAIHSSQLCNDLRRYYDAGGNYDPKTGKGGYEIWAVICNSRKQGNGNIELPDGTKVSMPDYHRVTPSDFKANGTNYILSGEELFARAYAQYVAVKSGDKALLAEIAKHAGGVIPSQKQAYDEHSSVIHLRMPPHSVDSGMTGPKEIFLSTHPLWTAEDFAPIERAFDALFRAKGMIA